MDPKGVGGQNFERTTAETEENLSGDEEEFSGEMRVVGDKEI